jgi:diacylglycerol kinase (ATP)
MSADHERAADGELARRKGFVGSMLYASNGLFRTLCTQRNMKIHWVSGLAVMLVGMALELELATRASIMFCVVLVICMEVLNTSLEAFVDLHIRQYARHAMVAKDAAAAAVLVLAIGAVIVFGDVLLHRWEVVENSVSAVVRTVIFGVPLLAATAAILFVRRSLLVINLLAVLALSLLGVLAWYSRDEVFSSCASAFVIGALFARYREPALLK